ncbi:MAG TPA: beta-eliminating lyase-related protein, partial [Flavisolibacter sp.]|nr:beta-eliminating lyase-related protein [Flavisolibacter sp.]
EFIKKARRIRKVFGGGMRQAGYLAAAGIYALKNNINRLKQDQEHARQIAEAIMQKDFVDNLLPVETNIIIFQLKPGCTAQKLVAKLKEHNILVHPISSNQIRLVTHLDITPQMVDKTIDSIKKL